MYRSLLHYTWVQRSPTSIMMNQVACVSPLHNVQGALGMVALGDMAARPNFAHEAGVILSNMSSNNKPDVGL